MKVKKKKELGIPPLIMLYQVQLNFAVNLTYGSRKCLQKFGKIWSAWIDSWGTS